MDIDDVCQGVTLPLLLSSPRELFTPYSGASPMLLRLFFIEESSLSFYTKTSESEGVSHLLYCARADSSIYSAISKRGTIQYQDVFGFNQEPLHCIYLNSRTTNSFTRGTSTAEIITFVAHHSHSQAHDRNWALLSLPTSSYPYSKP